MLLGVIVVALGSGSVLSHITGDGTFAETAARLAASERIYRVALSSVVIVSLVSILLAFALYVTLRPVNGLIALLAMIFNLADAFLGMLVRACSFVRLHLYLTARGADARSLAAEQLSNLLGTIAATTENIGGVVFGIASCLFFYLFLRSRYIPIILSALGLVASVVWTAMYFANLIWPEHHALFLDICFPLMAVAEIVTGLYLVVFAVRKMPKALAA